jgi:hypothetical protein
MVVNYLLKQLAYVVVVKSRLDADVASPRLELSRLP